MAQKIFFITLYWLSNCVQIDNVQQSHFQFFQLLIILVILIPKKFLKNLKLLVPYFFSGASQHITWKKKLKIVRVTVTSIWAGICFTSIDIFSEKISICDKDSLILDSSFRLHKMRSRLEIPDKSVIRFIRSLGSCFTFLPVKSQLIKGGGSINRCVRWLSLPNSLINTYS